MLVPIPYPISLTYMAITKTQIKKLENWLKEQGLRYEFSSVQSNDKPWIIIEIKNGDRIRNINSDNEEGKKLIKEGRVKYPKNPIIILDQKLWR